MNIIICGDSWLSQSVSEPDTHFGEILAKKLNANIEYHSKWGMSNACICIQIETAITKKPDLIIFNSTYAARTEIPLKTNNRVYYSSDHLTSFYSRYPVDDDILLATFPLNRTNTDDIVPVFENKDQKVNALKEYITYLYDDKLKTQLDTYMFLGIIKKLEMSNIRYIWCYDLLQSKNESFSWLDIKNDTRNEFKNIINNTKSPPMNQDPGYHTFPEIQLKLADIMYNKL